MTNLNNLGKVGQEIINELTPGSSVGKITNTVYGVANITPEFYFNEDGTLNTRGKFFMKEAFRLEGTEEYNGNIVETTEVVSSIRGHKMVTSCFNMSEEASSALATKIQATKADLTYKEYKRMMVDCDPQFRKFQETDLDGKKVGVKMYDIINPTISKWKLLSTFSGVKLIDNRHSVFDCVIYKTVVNNNIKFTFSYDACNSNPIPTFVEEYCEKGIDPSIKTGRLLIEGFGLAKIEMVKEVEGFINNDLFETFKDANKYKEDHKIKDVGYEIKCLHTEMIDYIVEETGVAFDNIVEHCSYQNALFRVNELLNAVYDGHKLEANMKTAILSSIGTELLATQKYAEFLCKKETGDIVKLERKITIKDAIAFSFEALTAKTRVRGGAEALNKFYSEEAFKKEDWAKGTLNANPMTGVAERVGKASIKASCRAFNAVYKVCGNTMATVIKDVEGNYSPFFVADKDIKEWEEQGYMLNNNNMDTEFVEATDGGVLVKDLPIDTERKVKIVVLDAARNVNGVEWFSSKIDDEFYVPFTKEEEEGIQEGLEVSSNEIIGAEDEQEKEFKRKTEVSESLKERVHKSRKNIKKLKEEKLGSGDILDLVGTKVVTINTAKKVLHKDGDMKKNRFIDKHGTPSPLAHQLFGVNKKGQIFYVGNTGRTDVKGTVIAAIRNVLLVEEN